MVIVFFDLETTGVDVRNDRIVEICLIRKDFTNGYEQVYTSYVNPEIPIPVGATEVHNITDEMVKEAPTFKQIATDILEFIGNAAIGGYNSNSFDVPLLYNELERAGINWNWGNHRYFDVCNVFKAKERRTLSAASIFYTSKVHEGAHSAEEDVLATIRVMEAQIKMYNIDFQEYEDISNNGIKKVDINNLLSKDTDGDIIFNFGKNRGKKAKNEKSYISWMIYSDFPKDVIKILSELL